MGGDPTRIYRELAWGALARFLLIDVRSHCDPAATNGDTRTPEGAVMLETGRTCLGPAQLQWLKDRLAAGATTWRLLGTGTNFLPLRSRDDDTPARRADPPPGFQVHGGNYLGPDSWDSYQVERTDLLAHIADQGIPNVVFTAGQTHVYFVGGLQPDFDDLDSSPTAAVEFVTGSLTADPDPRDQYFPGQPREEAEANLRGLEAAFLSINPQASYIDLINQGYTVVEVTPAAVTVRFRVIDTYDPDAQPTTTATFTVPVGSLPSFPAVDPPPLPEPEEPPTEPPPPDQPPPTELPPDQPPIEVPGTDTPSTAGTTGSPADRPGGPGPGSASQPSAPAAPSPVGTAPAAVPIPADPTFTG